MRISDWTSDVCSSDLRSVSVAMNALHLRAPARPGKRRTEAADEQHLRESVMTMNHSGGHAGHMPATGDRRALVISGWLTGLYFLVELGIGLWTGSVAVMSDAFHTFSAVGGGIGRASWRERGCQDVSISVVAGYLKKKQH